MLSPRMLLYNTGTLAHASCILMHQGNELCFDIHGRHTFATASHAAFPLNKTACFVCRWYTNKASSFSWCHHFMQTAAEGFAPRVKGSNFSVHQTPIASHSPSLIAQLWCHSAHAFHYTPQNGNKSNQGLLCLTMLSLQKMQLFYTDAILKLEDQNRVPGNNHFLVVFEECPSSEHSLDHPEWNYLKCLPERLEAQIKIGLVVQFSGERQSSQKLLPGNLKKKKRKNLTKWAWNLSCVKANKYQAENFWNGSKWMTKLDLKMRKGNNQQKTVMSVM